MNISFSEVFIKYNDGFELLEQEKIFLDILISIPLEIKFSEDELSNCQRVRELINYLASSSKIKVSISRTIILKRKGRTKVIII